MAGKKIVSSHYADRILENTPVGAVQITAGEEGLIALRMLADHEAHAAIVQIGSPPAERNADQAISELTQYFEGTLKQFTVRYSLDARSEYQQKVLSAVAEIPYGDVRTYGEIASQILSPKSARAVGGALAKNPIAIIIPCHRVVARDGRLHGFSSPKGIETKAWLLRHEGVPVANDSVQFAYARRKVRA